MPSSFEPPQRVFLSLSLFRSTSSPLSISLFSIPLYARSLRVCVLDFYSSSDALSVYAFNYATEYIYSSTLLVLARLCLLMMLDERCIMMMIIINDTATMTLTLQNS
jgi:hypothetical protein